MAAAAAAAAMAALTGCGECWCVVNGTTGCPSWRPPNYTAADAAAFRALKMTSPAMVLSPDSCNPYRSANCGTVPPVRSDLGPAAVCGVRFNQSERHLLAADPRLAADLVAPRCGSYELSSFSSAAEAAAKGYEADLATYMAIPDMTKTGKRCGVEAVLDMKAGINCFAKLGLTRACAEIWAYDAVADAKPCGGVCLREAAAPYNVPPTCRLNDCLQCDEDKSGPLFKHFAARTRRRSGLLSAIQRPCDSIAQIIHRPCGSKISLRARSPQSPSALPALPPLKRSSRWWFQTHTPQYTVQAINIVKAHRQSVTGVYMYGGLSFGMNGTFTAPPDAEIQSKTVPFLSLDLTVGMAVAVAEAAVLGGWAARGITAAADYAARNNLTSLMVDYEPATNLTQAHAEAYAEFVGKLATALQNRGVQLDMCVSSWGILDRFQLYSRTGVDGMMSMASTYYGRNVPDNEAWVTAEQAAGVSPSQLRVGVGSTNSIFQKWNYSWTESGFRDFTQWLQVHGVVNIDLWRTDIDTLNATNATAPWIYSTLAEFLANSTTAPDA